MDYAKENGSEEQVELLHSYQHILSQKITEKKVKQSKRKITEKFLEKKPTANSSLSSKGSGANLCDTKSIIKTIEVTEIDFSTSRFFLCGFSKKWNDNECYDIEMNLK